MEESRESPVEHGYYMPAEWEPHAQTWIGWPVILYLSSSFFFPCLFVECDNRRRFWRTESRCSDFDFDFFPARNLSLFEFLSSVCLMISLFLGSFFRVSDEF